MPDPENCKRADLIAAAFSAQAASVHDSAYKAQTESTRNIFKQFVVDKFPAQM
jgi:hypothetical protein